MEKGLILNLGLGDAFREVKSEQTDKEERRETQHQRTEMHDEQHFLKLSLRSVICEPEFQECIKGTHAKRARSIEEQVPAAISSSSNIKSSESQRKNGHQATNSFETDKEDGVAKKKLRLSQDQAASLEESFKKQSTLNPKQKLALAKQLNLKPRQVEVWFQNRRARTKLKKTEMDYEYLKRCCHMLTLENRRLQREVAKLRMLRINEATHPYYMRRINPSLCPSCKHAPNVSTSESVATVSFSNQLNTSAALVSMSAYGQIVTARQ